MSHSAIRELSGNLKGAFSTERATGDAESMRMVIRPCRKEDLARVATIHKSQFLLPGALLGQLSPALIAALYAAYLDQSVFLVHSSDGEVDGFALGGSSRVMLSCRLSFFRRHALMCLAGVAPTPSLAVGASFFRQVDRNVVLVARRGLAVRRIPPDIDRGSRTCDKEWCRHEIDSRFRGGDSRSRLHVRPECLENQYGGNSLLREVGFSTCR